MTDARPWDGYRPAGPRRRSSDRSPIDRDYAGTSDRDLFPERARNLRDSYQTASQDSRNFRDSSHNLANNWRGYRDPRDRREPKYPQDGSFYDDDYSPRPRPVSPRPYQARQGSFSSGNSLPPRRRSPSPPYYAQNRAPLPRQDNSPTHYGEWHRASDQRHYAPRNRSPDLVRRPEASRSPRRDFYVDTRADAARPRSPNEWDRKEREAQDYKTFVAKRNPQNGGPARAASYSDQVRDRSLSTIEHRRSSGLRELDQYRRVSAPVVTRPHYTEPGTTEKKDRDFSRDRQPSQQHTVDTIAPDGNAKHASSNDVRLPNSESSQSGNTKPTSHIQGDRAVTMSSPSPSRSQSRGQEAPNYVNPFDQVEDNDSTEGTPLTLEHSNLDPVRESNVPAPESKNLDQAEAVPGAGAVPQHKTIEASPERDSSQLAELSANSNVVVDAPKALPEDERDIDTDSAQLNADDLDEGEVFQPSVSDQSLAHEPNTENVGSNHATGLTLPQSSLNRPLEEIRSPRMSPRQDNSQTMQARSRSNSLDSQASTVHLEDPETQFPNAESTVQTSAQADSIMEDANNPETETDRPPVKTPYQRSEEADERAEVLAETISSEAKMRHVIPAQATSGHGPKSSPPPAAVSPAASTIPDHSSGTPPEMVKDERYPQGRPPEQESLAMSSAEPKQAPTSEDEPVVMLTKDATEQKLETTSNHELENGSPSAILRSHDTLVAMPREAFAPVDQILGSTDEPGAPDLSDAESGEVCEEDTPMAESPADVKLEGAEAARSSDAFSMPQESQELSSIVAAGSIVPANGFSRRKPNEVVNGGNFGDQASIDSGLSHSSNHTEIAHLTQIPRPDTAESFGDEPAPTSPAISAASEIRSAADDVEEVDEIDKSTSRPDTPNSAEDQSAAASKQSSIFKSSDEFISGIKQSPAYSALLEVVQLACVPRGSPEQPVLSVDADLHNQIKEENWAIVEESRTKDRRQLFSEPQEYKFYDDNISAFEQGRSKIVALLCEQQITLLHEEEDLKEEYEKRKKRWQQHAARCDRQRLIDLQQEEADAALAMSSLAPSRGTRNKPNGFDIKEAMIGLDLPNGALNEARIPALVTNPYDRAIYAFQDINDLVQQPLEFYHITKADPSEEWTEDEQAIFSTRYKLTPKQFGVIAAGLPGRTAQECVLHYYKTKKMLDYRASGRPKIAKAGGRARGRAKKVVVGRTTRRQLLATVSSLELEEDEIEDEAEAKSLRKRRAITDMDETSRKTKVVRKTPRKTGTDDAMPLEQTATISSNPSIALQPKSSLPQTMLHAPPPHFTSTPPLPAPILHSRSPVLQQAQAHQQNAYHSYQYPGKALSTIWTEADEAHFVELLKKFGTDYHALAANMPGKSIEDIQKHFDEFLIERGYRQYLPRPTGPPMRPLISHDYQQAPDPNMNRPSEQSYHPPPRAPLLNPPQYPPQFSNYSQSMMRPQAPYGSFSRQAPPQASHQPSMNPYTSTPTTHSPSPNFGPAAFNYDYRTPPPSRASFEPRYDGPSRNSDRNAGPPARGSIHSMLNSGERVQLPPIGEQPRNGPPENRFNHNQFYNHHPSNYPPGPYNAQQQDSRNNYPPMSSKSNAPYGGMNHSNNMSGNNNQQSRGQQWR